LDSAEEELRKDVGDIVSSKLESLLELSIRTSSGAGLDPFQDDLTCSLQNYTVIQKLCVVAFLAFGCFPCTDLFL
jgi:gamma-tubulin complex component 2